MAKHDKAREIELEQALHQNWEEVQKLRAICEVAWRFFMQGQMVPIGTDEKGEDVHGMVFEGKAVERLLHMFDSGRRGTGFVRATAGGEDQPGADEADGA